MDKRKKTKFALYDVLTLKAKYEQGWSKWTGGGGALYVFRHLPESDKPHSPVAQCYKDRRYFSGVFRTKKPLEFSGDIKDSATKRRTFIIFNFEGKDRMKIFQRA